MDALATRGHVILDDDQVRLRTSSGLGKFTDLFAQSAVSGVSQQQVTAQIDAAINALKGSAPALLDTLDELAAAISDDQNFSQTVLGLINQKQAALTVPASTVGGVSLLSSNLLKNLEFSGIVTVTETADQVLVAINGVSAANFALYNQLIQFNISQKQDALSNASGSGTELLNTATGPQAGSRWGFYASYH